MKILGLEYDVWLYSLVGTVGGFGIGIMFSNVYLLSLKIGLLIALTSVILSVYIWIKYIKKYFVKGVI